MIFTAQDLLDLVRSKGIVALEDHIAALFAMHHEERAGLLGATYGVVLGGFVAVAIALLAPGVDPANQELYWGIISAIGIAWAVICLVIIILQRERLALLRVESAFSK